MGQKELYISIIPGSLTIQMLTTVEDLTILYTELYLAFYELTTFPMFQP